MQLKSSIGSMLVMDSKPDNQADFSLKEYVCIYGKNHHKLKRWLVVRKEWINHFNFSFKYPQGACTEAAITNISKTGDENASWNTWKIKRVGASFANYNKAENYIYRKTKTHSSSESDTNNSEWKSVIEPYIYTDIKCEKSENEFYNMLSNLQEDQYHINQKDAEHELDTDYSDYSDYKYEFHGFPPTNEESKKNNSSTQTGESSLPILKIPRFDDTIVNIVLEKVMQVIPKLVKQEVNKAEDKLTSLISNIENKGIAEDKVTSSISNKENKEMNKEKPLKTRKIMNMDNRPKSYKIIKEIPIAVHNEALGLPITTKESFERLEKLMGNVFFENDLKTHIHNHTNTIPSTCPLPKVVKSILQLLIVREACILFNFNGSRKKINFSTSKVYHIIFDVIRSSWYTEQPKNQLKNEVDANIRKWLNNTREAEINKRKKRIQKRRLIETMEHSII